MTWEERVSQPRNTARRMASATAIAAIGLAVALGTSGCGAGQVSQTANQLPAVNGASATLGSMKLRDVQIIYPAEKADEVFGDGGPFEVSFVIANESPIDNDKLLSITPEKGKVSIEGNTEIIAGKALRAGSPAGLLEPSTVETVDGEERATATLTDAGDTVASGLTTKLVFRFEKAGEVTVQTPVDSGTYMVRQDTPRQAEPPAYEQGH